MAEQHLDCRGLPCPQPVLKCKNAIEAELPETLSATVDNEPARENVTRFMESKGYQAVTRSEGENWVVTGVRSEDTCRECEIMTNEEIASHAVPAGKGTVVFITSDTMGQGDDELGSKLIFNFIGTLPEIGTALWRVILVNAGVHLACDGHPALEKLQELERSGVSLLVCGTCLEFFNSLEKKRVGETTNMLDVVTSLQLASKVIQV